MPRQPLFNFEPVHTLVDMKRKAKLQKHVAALHTSTGQFRLSASYIRDHSLNGAYIKLYADVAKKAIGWKVFREGNLEELKGMHRLQCKTYSSKSGKNELCTISVTPLVRMLGLTEKSYLKLPILKYSTSLLEGDIYYVELTKQNHDNDKNRC